MSWNQIESFCSDLLRRDAQFSKIMATYGIPTKASNVDLDDFRNKIESSVLKTRSNQVKNYWYIPTEQKKARENQLCIAKLHAKSMDGKKDHVSKLKLPTWMNLAVRFRLKNTKGSNWKFFARRKTNPCWIGRNVSVPKMTEKTEGTSWNSKGNRKKSWWKNGT